MNFYNENEQFCVEWLNNLKAAGLIPEGTIDGRSIAGSVVHHRVYAVHRTIFKES